MAHQGLIALALALAACSPAARPVPIEPPRATRAPVLGDASWGQFHSARHAITLWLPDGRAWKIDDHRAPELVAVHAPTGSRVRVRLVQDAGELTNRAKCADRAAEAKFVDTAALSEITSEEGIDKNGWDTRIFVGVGASRLDPVGHVIELASFMRKCLWFDFETRSGDAEELQDRLLLAHTKILPKLVIDTFGELPRQK